MERKVYVPTAKNSGAKMHLKFDCSCLYKNGAQVERVYVTESEAIAMGVTETCKKCSKPKSRKGA